MKILVTLLSGTAFLLGTLIYSQSNTSGFVLAEKAKKVVASKVYVTKDIPVTDFKKIRLSGSADMTFVQKPGAPRVEVYTSDNIVDLLDIHVERGTLYVGFKNNVSVSLKKLEVRVYAESLTDISLSGSGDIEIKKGLRLSDDLTINLAGSGDVEVGNITCRHLRVSLSGSGDVELGKVTSESTEIGVVGSGDVSLKGATYEATYSVTGSGDINAKDYKAHHVSARVIGSGDISCFAEERLEARVSGTGEIGYKGYPMVDASKKGVKRL